MEFKDQILKCVVCGTEFIFTADRQRYHAQKGYTTSSSKSDSTLCILDPKFIKEFNFAIECGRLACSNSGP
jgi:hypothetical protein